jgi:uncharacterized RDD family membrane protein YckC
MFLKLAILTNKNMQFPNLFRRYVASLIDLIAVVAFVGFIGKLPLAMPENFSGITVFMIVIVLYEPIFTVFACTIGQLVMRIRVRRCDGQERLGFLRAVFRTLVKYSLGVISFLSMPAQIERRAMHDLAAGTLVLDASDTK